MTFRIFALILAVLVGGLSGRPAAADPPQKFDGPLRVAQGAGNRDGDVPGEFAFYVLALSWSPSWCAENRGRSPRQCRAARPYHFVVHGLWPQNERDWPESCPGPDRFVPEEVAREILPIMPSRPLIFHEWRKHGVCSGLTAEAYFDLVREAYEAIVIPEAWREIDEPLRVDPDDIESGFIEANPGLSEEGMSVVCRGNRLREVRICLTRDLEFRSCERIDRRGCRAGSIVMPPARGGR